jgi:hypothetical protein
MTEKDRFIQWWNRNFDWADKRKRVWAWKAWQAARDWIPIEKALPENGQRVLFVVYPQDEQYAGTIQAGRFMIEEYGNDSYAIFSFPGRGSGATHWQPLPEPPEDWRGE